jgi:serine/threonine protein phosphatase PrpC
LVEELRSRGMNGDLDGMGHVVTRAVGVATDAVPELRRELVREGDTFLLCSDGVTDAVGDEIIRECLSLDDVDTCCDMLIRSAFDAGGSDNITALVLRFR